MPIESRRVVYLTPHDDAYTALLNMAKAATKSIHILIYGFTISALGDILIEKHQAGLEVGVVADRTQSGGKTQKALLQRLVDAGISVTISTSITGAILHTKAMLVDMAAPDGANANESFVAYGSFNFSGDGTVGKDGISRSGAEAQDNVLISENNAVLCSYFYQQFLETQTYGREHVKQLLPTTPPAMPQTQGEVKAATASTPPAS